MTLRARLALSLGILAAASVVTVAVVSYVATDHRLRQDLDAQLVGAAGRFADPDGRVAHMVCDAVRQGGALGGAGPGQEFGGVLAGLQGAALQCVDANGKVTAWVGPVNLPVLRSEIRVTGTSPSPTSSSTATPTFPNGPPPTTVPGGPGRPVPHTQVERGQAYRVVSVPVAGGGEIRIARSLADTERVLDSIRSLSIGVGIAVIALAAAGGWVIARRTTRPVLRLTDAAEAVGATGELGIAVPSAGRDEVGRLARAFRSMLDALNRSRAQQQRLVQDAGHELRTPLTSLRSNIDTLRRHPDLADEPRERLLTDLESEVRELSGLVDELVALAVDRYDNEPEQRVQLDELAARAAQRAERRSGRVITVDTEPATAIARPGQLLRAIGNLLDNAAKFSADDTPIELLVRDRRIEVRDRGPGIAAADLPHVFDRFYRAVDLRSLPGSGLGLAIVREAVETAGGHVEAANRPDGGAGFTIELPAPPNPA